MGWFRDERFQEAAQRAAKVHRQMCIRGQHSKWTFNSGGDDQATNDLR